MVEVTDVTCLGLSSITEKLQKTEQQVGVPAEQHPGLLFVRGYCKFSSDMSKREAPIIRDTFNKKYQEEEEERPQ